MPAAKECLAAKMKGVCLPKRRMPFLPYRHGVNATLRPSPLSHLDGSLVHSSPRSKTQSTSSRIARRRLFFSWPTSC